MQISGIFSILAAAGIVAALPQGTSTTCPGPTIDYVVQSKDTLTTIAEKFDSGICDIASLNKLADPNFIPLNQTLHIPTNLCNPDNTSCLTKPGTATCVVGGPSTWTVGANETFYIIAQKLGLDYTYLEAKNPTVDPLNLYLGEVLDVPVCK